MTAPHHKPVNVTYTPAGSKDWCADEGLEASRRALVAMQEKGWRGYGHGRKAKRQHRLTTDRIKEWMRANPELAAAMLVELDAPEAAVSEPLPVAGKAVVLKRGRPKGSKNKLPNSEAITPSDSQWVRDLLRRETYHSNVHAPGWLGVEVAKRFGLDLANKIERRRVHKIILQWLIDGVIVKRQDEPHTRRPYHYDVGASQCEQPQTIRFDPSGAS